MRITARDVALALSLANLCFARVWLELFQLSTPNAFYLYFSNADIVAAGCNVLLLAAAFLLATATARRYGERGRRAIIAGFVLVIGIQLSGVGPILAPGFIAVLDRWRDGKVLEALAPLAVLALIAFTAWRWPRQSLRFAVGTVYALTPLVVLTFARGAWIIASVDPTETLAPEAPPIGSPVRSADGPRVVVVVLDALGRRHAFDARPASVALPNLDRLRAQSVDATDVEQIGNKTILSVPAMLTDLPVVAAEPTEEDELLLKTADGATHEFTETPTILDRAQDLGGVAVVAGWYLPYCRMFEELDGCASYPARVVGSRARRTGFLRALVDQQLAIVPYVNLRIRQVDVVLDQYADVLAASTTGDRGLVFLHVAAPHTPWIWDGEDSSFTITRFAHDGYYDNIELADKIVGDIRRKMEAAGQWDSTAVLLLSDHVMRYRPEYLHEPEDDRVPFLLKLPGQSRGAVFTEPLSALVTHDLVLALLEGRVQTPEQALAWLERAADERPPNDLE